MSRKSYFSLPLVGRAGLGGLCYVALILTLLAYPAAATPPWPVQQSAQCDAAIAATEKRYPIPHGLLGSIARVESGRPITSVNDVRAWPWAIDAEGRGLFLDSKPAAVAWVQQAHTRNVQVIDVGCMQVNLFYHPAAFPTLDQAFDPAANTDYAARFLLSLYQGPADHSWPIAVGLYHSGTPELADEYRARVAATGAGIISGIGGPEPLYLRTLRHGALHLQLAGGGMLVLHVNRQPHMAWAKRMNSCQAAELLAPLLYRKPNETGCHVR